MIFSMYRTHLLTKNKPPASKEDLIGAAAQTTQVVKDPNAIFRSPRDGEEYLIQWGVEDLRRTNDEVLAQESKGVDGVRKAINCKGRIVQLPAE
jgi:hypothetical protein